VFVARTQRWNYTQAGLSNTPHILNDLERNAIHQEPDYTKHINNVADNVRLRFDGIPRACVVFKPVVVYCRH